MKALGQRRTVVVHNRLTMREYRLTAARERQHGLQIMTFEQLAVRLTGGLARPVDDATLWKTIGTVLSDTELGELDQIKDLPGMTSAAADTLRKAWRAGLDLQSGASEHPRLGSIAALETAVLDALPAVAMRPTDLAKTALERLGHAAVLFGPVDIVGITELSPIWRDLLHGIAGKVPVRWIAGPRTVPDWLDSGIVQIVREEPQKPEILVVSAASAYHEAVEAMRWVRHLLASGKAEPADIAIASVMPADYDDHFLALRSDANFDLHFVHGVKITASRAGQVAAALADILLRGLSQTRVRRLNTLLRNLPGPFGALPDDWLRILPDEAPLSSPEAWKRVIDGRTADGWSDGNNHNAVLAEIVELLARGITAAEETGERLLHGQMLAIWRKALASGPAASLDLTLETLKQDDGLDPCLSACWMPANALAASPRRFVRLLGLNFSHWPRGIVEDRLLSDRIIPRTELDPLPVATADRRDFQTIYTTVQNQVVLSRARRDDEGRLLGRSTLLMDFDTDELFLRRNGVPNHAFSETDRLMARPREFGDHTQAQVASTCWRNWFSNELTPHDGVVRPDHPAIHAVLDRTHSASSLSLTLRNPLGFVWQYGLRWRGRESGEEPLVLDSRAMGDLVHQTLDLALRTLEESGGLSTASKERIDAAVQRASGEIAQSWEADRAVPPAIIWRRTLDVVREMSKRALAFREEQMPGVRAYGEVPFGGAPPKSDVRTPWDPRASVEIPGVGFRISGYIDRLDVSGDKSRALVRDYKTGRAPKRDIVLNGGRELQRCLYAFAVKALLGDLVSIGASLHYLSNESVFPLKDPDATLEALTGYLEAARTALITGAALMGPDAGGDYDDLAFALPANASATYRLRKEKAVHERLGDATRVWGEL